MRGLLLSSSSHALRAISPASSTTSAAVLAAFLFLFSAAATTSAAAAAAAAAAGSSSLLSLQRSSYSNDSDSEFRLFVGAYCNGSTAFSTGEGCWKGAPSWTGELDMVELNKCLGGVMYSCSVDAGVVLRIYADHDTTCSAAVKSKLTVVPPRTFNQTTFDAKTNTSMHFTCETSLEAVVGNEPWVAFSEYFGVDNCSAVGAGHYTLRQVDRCLTVGTLDSQTLNSKLTWLPNNPPVLTTTYVKVKTYGSSFSSTFALAEAQLSEPSDARDTTGSISCSGNPTVEYFEQGRCAELSGGLSSLVTCDASAGYSHVQFSQPNCRGNAHVVSSVAAADLNLCAASDGQASGIVVTCNVTAFDANDATGLLGYVEHGYNPTNDNEGVESCSGPPVYLSIGSLSECRNSSTSMLVLSERKEPINHPSGPDPFPNPPSDDSDLASWKIAVIAVVSSVVVALGLATFFLVRRPLKKRKVSSTSSAVSSPTRRALVLDAEEHPNYDAF